LVRVPSTLLRQLEIDPADRIIGATALAEGLSLITADREIHRSKVVHTIW
jgi:PIN domain nuclease of toxin-antitoxin system